MRQMANFKRFGVRRDVLTRPKPSISPNSRELADTAKPQDRRSNRGSMGSEDSRDNEPGRGVCPVIVKYQFPLEHRGT